ncbi:Cerato-platanin-domain-containing protein [Lactarius indigo]|nr:Cerato-platanin-domain-containing protein [Lactarius indigo]
MSPHADSPYRTLFSDLLFIYLLSGVYLVALVQNARDIKAQRIREHSHRQPTIQRTFSNHILTMKLTSTIVSLAALFSVAFADNWIHDPRFTAHIPKHCGVYAVGGWNSPQCGSCWRLTYKGKSIYVTAIDTIFDGFQLSLGGMNALTNGKARVLDRVDAKATQVDCVALRALSLSEYRQKVLIFELKIHLNHDDYRRWYSTMLGY